MSNWAKMRNGIIGMVVAKFKIGEKWALGLDLGGNGDIWYVEARECTPYNLPKKAA